MKGHSNQRNRVYLLLLGVALYSGAIMSSCGPSGKGVAMLNGYAFTSESATLTNRYFPASAGQIMSFVGYGAYAGRVYTWTLSEGEVLQGVSTLREKGTLTGDNGETTVVFDSMLAQDTAGNVHVLKNISGDTGTLSGVAAGLSATILMPGLPKVGDRFAPAVHYIGTVLALDETVESYTGVLHTRFIVEEPNGTQSRYDDYWAPGIGQVKSVWSLADGTTGYWLRLYPDFHTMQADLQACMQPGAPGEDARMAFSEKYDVPLSNLEPLGAPTASDDWYEVTCMGEILTLVGAVIWRYFATTDGWKLRGPGSCGPEHSYCVAYRRNCGGWPFEWCKGCLEQKIGPRCFSH